MRMSKIDRHWPLDAFDAISLSAIDADFEISAGDGSEILLWSLASGLLSDPSGDLVHIRLA